jgi:hypothetical protein
MTALLGRLLLAISGSMGIRIMAALGITIGSYAGMTYTVDALISNIQSSYNGIASTTLILLNLAGFGQALGIMLGAYVTKASLQAVKAFIGKAV